MAGQACSVGLVFMTPVLTGDALCCAVLCCVQLTSPVQWETTLQTLLDKGLTKSYEVGPGKVIAGLMKRLDKKADITNVIA
jgi:malonyl CoA-acyl carrier protein transacylase